MRSQTMQVGRAALGAFILVLGIGGVAVGQEEMPQDKDLYDQLFRRFIEAAREASPPADTAISTAWMTDLSLDVRARHLNDVVTVRVIESIAGNGAADSALAKESSSFLSLPNFFGLEDRLPSSVDPSSLVRGGANTDFEGSGQTARTGTLTGIIAARVAEVMPNGDLRLEGIREIDINGDRQMVLLTGMVRPTDISPDNVVLSTSIGQLRIRYFGEGLIKDNLKPGWLVRILNKVF